MNNINKVVAILSIKIQIHSNLHEFSAIDTKLIESLNAEQRRPFIEEYWAQASLTKRMGDDAEIFTEFYQRVEDCERELGNLADKTLLVGHGKWRIEANAHLMQKLASSWI